MKDTDHPIRHPCGHFGHRPSAQRTRGCAGRDDQFGHGQNTGMGWSDPTFAHGSVAKVMRGVAPAHEILFDVLPAGAAGFRTKHVKDEIDSGEAGKDYAPHFHCCQLLHSMLGLRNWFSSLCNNRACESRRAKKVKSALRANAYREAAWGSPENLSDNMSDILYEQERRSQLSILKAPPKQPKTVTVQARVEESVKTQLERYAEFIDASPSYVITEALKLLFRKDDEFRRWADQHTNNYNNEKPKGDVLAKAV